MKKQTFNAFAITCFLTAFVSFNNIAQTTPKAADKQNEKNLGKALDEDAEFAVMAADIGMLEVKLGKLAITNHSSAKVDEVGEHMVKDHTKANEELKTIAAKKNITLANTLCAKSEKEYKELAKLKGKDFDREYLEEMVSGHKKAIKAFEEESTKGNDGDLKTWALDKIPTLKHHLQMSETALAEIK